MSEPNIILYNTYLMYFLTKSFSFHEYKFYMSCLGYVKDLNMGYLTICLFVQKNMLNIKTTKHFIQTNKKQLKLLLGLGT